MPFFSPTRRATAFEKAVQNNRLVCANIVLDKSKFEWYISIIPINLINALVKLNKFWYNKNNLYLCTTKNGEHPIWNDESVAQQVEHNTFNVGVPGSSPGGFTQKRRSKAFSFCVNRYATHPHTPSCEGAYALIRYSILELISYRWDFGYESSQIPRLRTLQRHKIGRNSMQFPSPDNSNPKRREKCVTNFSLSQKRLRLFAEHLRVWKHSVILR